MSDATSAVPDDSSRPDLHVLRPVATVATVMDAFSRLRVENTRALDVLAARFGITPTDIRALFFIGGADDVTPKRVAQYLGLTTGAMTTLVDRLESAGLVARLPHPTDRRSLLLHVTEVGRTAAAFAGELYTTAFADALEGEDLEVAARVFTRAADELRRGAERIAAG